MSYDFDLLVIGAGSGGVRCSRIAASLGARVAIVESRHWGGTCVNLGCVPKKLMVYGSHYHDEIRDSRGYGWSYQALHHDWQTLIEGKNKEIARLDNIYISMLEKSGITLFVGHGSFKDNHTVSITPSPLDPKAPKREVTAKYIVIATGSEATKLDIEGAQHAIVSDDIFSLTQRPQKFTVIGSGYIGIEFAGVMAGLGSDVNLIYRRDYPLRGFDEDLRHALRSAIEQRGIVQHHGRTPQKIIKKSDKTIVLLDNGEEVESDAVLMATGRHPKIASLGLENTQVTHEKNGRIITNTQDETKASGVYAIGDVSNENNLTPVAIAQGHNLAQRLFSKEPPRTWCWDTIPKAVFFSPPIATVGLTEEQASKIEDSDVYTTQFTPLRYKLTGRECKTFMKLIVSRETQKVLGVHILGDDAPEMIQTAAVTLTGGLTKRDYDRTVSLHPTSAEELVTMRSCTRHVDKH